MQLTSLLKPDQAFVVRLGQTTFSYAELDGASARVASLLRGRGVSPGDHVAVMLGRVAELPSAYYGVLRTGAVVVPIDVGSSAGQVEVYLTSSGARLVLAWHECLDAAEAGARDAGVDYIVVHPIGFHALLEEMKPVVDADITREPDDIAVLLYAPTTTGTVHAIEVTHAELRAQAGENGEIVIPLMEEQRC
ncbi:Linear gramicidin synthase subunit A [Paraconexibacter sp. AEG42_29]|uniref:Linear gramicidin synthase subunit A n=1 Tax=Paraconexibacter sp. AEG42_29 TaxID=2997339 RepID=A0AAU7AP88_9ACTN